MNQKKTSKVLFAYDDGSYEYALGDHAQEVMEWLNAAQGMLCAHGENYSGRKMIEVSNPRRTSDLEPIGGIAARVFPEEVASLGDDKMYKNLWFEECDESARLNRR